jgi:hypothetical protein
MTVDRRTKLIHPQVKAPENFRLLVTPAYRSSTTRFVSASRSL